MVGQVEDAASQLTAARTSLAQLASGKGPEAFDGTAAQTVNDLQALATDVATFASAIGDLKAAVAKWQKDAPPASEMNAAEKALTDAEAARVAAVAASDADPENDELDRKAAEAGQKVIDARKELDDKKSRRETASEAYFAAVERAMAKLRRITGVDSTDAPSTPTSPAPRITTGTPLPATTTRTPPSSTQTPAKPSGNTPASPSKPSNETPTTTSGDKGSGLDASTLATLAAAAQQGQGQQGQQPQQQQAQMPSMPTVPQQNQNQQKPSEQDALRRQAEENGNRALAAAGLEVPTDGVGGLVTGLGGGPGSGAPSGPAAPAPGSQNSTTYRPAGTPIQGTTTGGAPTPPTPLNQTTGNSVQNMTTPTDTSGRPGGAQTSAFGGPGTHTSAAESGTATKPGEQQQHAGQRPVGGPGMMPGVMGAPAGGGGGNRGGADGDKDKPITRYDPEQADFHGQTAIGEAVQGGTIAQNKPERRSA